MYDIFSCMNVRTFGVYIILHPRAILRGIVSRETGGAYNGHFRHSYHIHTTQLRSLKVLGTINLSPKWAKIT